MDLETLYQAIRALPLTERLRLIERVAHDAAEASRADTAPVSPGVPMRGMGMDAGKVTVADDFDAPLPPEIQRYFDGEDDDDTGGSP